MALGYFGGGRGTIVSPFLIEDAFDLDAIRHNIYNGKCYRLVNDINLCELPNYDEKGWTPIEYFNGYIDGNFHSIYNLYIDSDDTHTGFIKHLAYETITHYKLIENLNIENAEIHGKGISAILAGMLTPYPISNPNNEYSYIFNGVTVNGKVYGNNIGGLIGELNHGSQHITLMKNCHIGVEVHPAGKNCSVGLVCGIDRKSVNSSGYNCYIYDSVVVGNVIQEDVDNTPVIKIGKNDIFSGYNITPTYSNCYCNKLNYDQQTPNGIKVLDGNHLYNQASYSGLVDNKAYKLNGRYDQSKELDERYWVFKHNKIPDLFFTDNNNNNNNIRIKDKFYSYDESSNSFIEIDTPDLLDSDEANRHRIKDFNAINTDAYIRLLDKFRDEDLSGKAFIYNSKKSPLKFTTVAVPEKFTLSKDTDVTLKNNKEVQRKTFYFESDLVNEFSLYNRRSDIVTEEVGNNG